MVRNKHRNNKTVLAVFGFILVIFGILGAIPFAISREIFGLGISAMAVVIGVLVIAWAISD